MDTCKLRNNAQDEGLGRMTEVKIIPVHKIPSKSLRQYIVQIHLSKKNGYYGLEVMLKVLGGGEGLE